MDSPTDNQSPFEDPLWDFAFDESQLLDLGEMCLLFPEVNQPTETQQEPQHKWTTQENPTEPSAEGEQKKRKRKSVNSTKEDKKRKKDADGPGYEFQSSTSVSLIQSSEHTSASRKASRQGWLEKICSTIDVPTDQLILPPVVGTGGKKHLKFHTVQF